MLRVAGRLPLCGLTLSQRSVLGMMAAVNVGVPKLAFTEIFCADGRVVAPDWYVNVTADGVAVAVTVELAWAIDVRTLQRRSIFPTWLLSPEGAGILVPRCLGPQGIQLCFFAIFL